MEQPPPSSKPGAKAKLLAAKARAALANNPDMPQHIRDMYQRVIDRGATVEFLEEMMSRSNKEEP